MASIKPEDSFSVISIHSSGSVSTISSSLSINSSENESLMHNSPIIAPNNVDTDEWNDDYSRTDSNSDFTASEASGSFYDSLSDEQPHEALFERVTEALKREGIPIQAKQYSSKFVEVGMLGKGAYGCVFLVQQKDTTERYAVKKVEVPLDAEMVYKMLNQQKAQKIPESRSALRTSSELISEINLNSTCPNANDGKKAVNKRLKLETTDDHDELPKDDWRAMGQKLMQRLMAEVETMRKLSSKPTGHSGNIIKFYSSWLELSTTASSPKTVKRVKYGLPKPITPGTTSSTATDNVITGNFAFLQKRTFFPGQANLSIHSLSDDESTTFGQSISNDFDANGRNSVTLGTDLSGASPSVLPRPRSPTLDPDLIEDRVPRSMLMASHKRKTTWGLTNETVSPSPSAGPSQLINDGKSPKISRNITDDSFLEEQTLEGDDFTDSSESASYASELDYLAESLRNPHKSCFQQPPSSKPTAQPLTPTSSVPKFVITLYIQMELCSSNSLHSWLWEPGRILQPALNLRFFQQIMSGLAHVHLRGFFHRDVKPDNLMMVYAKNGEASVKLGDFGLTKKIGKILPAPVVASSSMSASIEEIEMAELHASERRQGGMLLLEAAHTKGRGTAMYMAPEIWRGGHYNEKVDIYAAGLVLFELFNTWSTGSERIYALKRLKEERFIDEDFRRQHPEIAEMVLIMTNTDPQRRPSALDVLSSPMLARFQLLEET